MRRRKTERRPVIPLRDMVVFPGAKVPLVVGRPASIEAVRTAVSGNREVFLVAQEDADVLEPTAKDLHRVGTVGRILKDSVQEDGHYRLVVEGLSRAQATSMEKEDVHLTAVVTTQRAPKIKSGDASDLRARLSAALERYSEARGDSGLEGLVDALASGDFLKVCDEVCAALPLPASDQQELLQTFDGVERARLLEALLEAQVDRMGLDRQLNRKVQTQVEKGQREYLLQEKLKVIRKELGDARGAGDLDDFQPRLDAAGLPQQAREKADREYQRLQAMPTMSAEATVVRDYLDWLIEVPWTERSEERSDFDEAAAVLDEDHHGLRRVKERVLEFLAVRALREHRQERGSILCLVGPPGVGKTSLGRSIARAMGRCFVRLSLGGVRDEAEIRGHRRTYVGAYPGRIVQGMRKAGTRNPVFLLDEIDKMAVDFRGDPAAALLEVLDPAQNSTFLDHYLDVEYDLSEVLFLCTANVMHSIPPALQDRLEVIRLAGYTLEEKKQIAERFLLPRQLDEHGLKRKQLKLSSAAIEAVAESWTREAGVRGLERELATLCRKLAVRVVRDPKAKLNVRSASQLNEFLGAPLHRSTEAQAMPEVGVATGLSWTAAGGSLLLVEAALMTGTGKLSVTGQLGDVMEESLKAAVAMARSRADELGVADEIFAENDIHVHVPEGAIPKDGPSAGVTMAVAVISALTRRPARHDIAMTGEITLRGRVLPVGGLREKLLAAERAGILTVLVPAGSQRELEDVPASVMDRMEIVEVEKIEEVLEAVLLPQVAARKRSASRGGRTSPRTRRGLSS